MRMIIAFAIATSLALGLGGCFGHHQKAVAVEPVYTPPFK